MARMPILVVVGGVVRPNIKRARLGSPGPGGTVLAYYDSKSGEPVYRLPEPKSPPSGERQGRASAPINGTVGDVEATADPRGSRKADYARYIRAMREAVGDS